MSLKPLAAFALATATATLLGCPRGNPAVVCQSDADCAGTGRTICGRPGLPNTCVECYADNTCASGLCLADGTCGQCGPSAPCARGQVCGDDGKCADGCATETAGCAGGGFCLAGSSDCVECATDFHCGTGRICSPNHTCTAGCSAQNPTCPPGQICDPSGKICVGCLSSADCTSPQLPSCNPATSTCVACVSNSDCHAPTSTCNPATHACVACLGDTGCALGTVCQGNACIAGCTATHGCAGGLLCDVPSGLCVACLTDAQCGGAVPRCDLSTHACVACLPGATDNCPSGDYCRADHVCERGCKTSADCGGYACLADHSCSGCTADSQCVAGKICSSGACIAACGPSNPCGAGKDCCGQHCVDSQADVANCGACGNACGAGQTCCQGLCSSLDTAAHCGACGNSCGAGSGCCGGNCAPINTQASCGGCGVACGTDQFCDGLACVNRVFPNFCANKTVYAIYDGIAIDDAATVVLASTIHQYCSATTVITYGAQSNPAWVDQTTGALVIGGGSTVVTAGGPFPNKPVKWLERTNKVTKVYFSTNGVDTYSFKRRSNDVTLTSMTVSECTPHHDKFLIELATDPVSGTLTLIGYGVCGNGYGTQAAAYFWSNVMLPSLGSYPDAWYLFDWDDQNADSVANGGDLFTQLASGL